MAFQLSETIKKLRKEKNMTQGEVAERLGVAFQSVSKWENGLTYPDVGLLPSIASLFGVSLDQLFGVDADAVSKKLDLYKKEDEALGDDTEARITLVKKTIGDLPGNGYLKFRLLWLYHKLGFDKARKHLDEMRSLCRAVLEYYDDTDWYRDEAISYLIDVEDDDRVNEWYSLLDNRSIITSSEAKIARYDYRGEVDAFNLAMQRQIFRTMDETFLNYFVKRDAKTYKSAQSRVDGQNIILKLIDVMRDPETDLDGWIYTREFAYRRLAAGCFGAGLIEDGYRAMERSVDLCLKLRVIPDGTKLAYNCPALDLLKREIRAEDVKDLLQNAYDTFVSAKGWAWFRGVRNEERFIALANRLKG